MTLTLPHAVALFGAMALLAALPSVSVLAVTSRAASSRFESGAAVALGVVAGDVIFILAAMLGLTALPDSLATWLAAAGGAYLIWLGITLWRREQRPSDADADPAAAREASASAKALLMPDFLAGLFITLGDLKAILFYLGFLPVFVDIAAATAADVFAVAAIAVLAVGGVKLAYAWIAWRAGRILKFAHASFVHRVAAVVLVVIGLLVMGGALSQDATAFYGKVS